MLWSNDLNLSGANGVTCSYAKDITFKSVHIAAQENPYVEDHSENIQRIGWNEITFVPTTQ